VNWFNPSIATSITAAQSMFLSRYAGGVDDTLTIAAGSALWACAVLHHRQAFTRVDLPRNIFGVCGVNGECPHKRPADLFGTQRALCV
jgi:hypothetical protein